MLLAFWSGPSALAQAAASVRPDLSAIELRGNTHRDDSFSMAMIAAAKVLGSKADLDYGAVYCRSTNAFAPMINTAENCTAHWACEGCLADKVMDKVAGSLGLRATKLKLPEFNYKWDDASKLDARRRIAGIVRQAMDEGNIVLTTGGWDVGLKQIDGKWKPVGPRGFVFWAAAGIITRADPQTGTILGAHPNGHHDNPITWPKTMWSLALAPRGPATASSSDRQALRLAVQRIRAQRRFQRDGHATYGTDAMDAWADHMATVKGFCAPCFAQGPEASVGDALDNGKRLHKAAGIAARYLRSLCDSLPQGMHTHLKSAAARYDQVVEMIAPAVTGKSPEHYRQWLGNRDKQRVHAELLRRIDAELLAAAESIEAALAAQPLPTVTLRREGKRVWLDGAKELFHRHFEDSEDGRVTPWAERSDTYMYLTQMRIAGWDIDYATLNTVAGYGPSFAYAPGPKDKWMVHYFPPKGRDSRIAHATGCRCRWRRYKDVEAYWQALKQAIDEGQAVHGPNEEDVLFTGYVDAEEPEARKVLPLAIVFVDDDEWTWAQFKKWHSRRMVSGWLGRIEGREDPWPATKSAVEVMRMMVTVAGGDDSRRRPKDRVVWGVEGIEAYAADLADRSKSGAPTGDGGYFQGGWRGCHNIYPQMSGRPAAAKYLKRVARLFEGDVRTCILAAAIEYGKATQAWKAFAEQLGRDPERVAGVEHRGAWTTEKHRAAGAAAVAEAADHEQAAIAALQGALDAMPKPGK